MFEKGGWILKVPKDIRRMVAKTFAKCTRDLGTSPAKLRKLMKSDKKKARKVDLQIHSCLLKGHPVLRGPRQWARVSTKSR